MENKKFDTIYEKILASVLKVMYRIKKSQMSGETGASDLNFYDLVYNEIKNSDEIEYPTIADIDELYNKLDEIESKSEERSL